VKHVKLLPEAVNALASAGNGAEGLEQTQIDIAPKLTSEKSAYHKLTTRDRHYSAFWTLGICHSKPLSIPSYLLNSSNSLMLHKI
jgi:hypothetical protein